MGAVAIASPIRPNIELQIIQGKIDRLQEQMRKVTIMTIRKRKVFSALRSSLEYCGYDLDALMATKCRERTLTDLRAIVWAIYQDEMSYSYPQVALDFNWNRSTVFSGIRRARILRESDRNFCDMYDSVHGAYINALSVIEENSSKN